LRQGVLGVWPEVTIEASNQGEVNCLLRALRKEGHTMLVREGFRVEVGGARPAAILSAVQACLTNEGIDSVFVVLKSGSKAMLSRAGADKP
jgi:hypothetical protein